MWSKNLVELLIAKYKENECLYDINHPMYTNRVKRHNTLLKICSELKPNHKDITVEELKKKIHNLRSQYMRQLRDFEISKKFCIGLKEIEPKLWCFQQLNFLKPHCTIKKSVCHSESDETTEVIRTGKHVSKKQIDSKAEIQRNKKKKNCEAVNKVDNIRTSFSSSLMKKKRYDWLGKQVVFELDSIEDQVLQKETAWKIQKILREASIKHISKKRGTKASSPISPAFETVTIPYKRDSSSPAHNSYNRLTPPSSYSRDNIHSYESSSDTLLESLDDSFKEEEF